MNQYGTDMLKLHTLTMKQSSRSLYKSWMHHAISSTVIQKDLVPFAPHMQLLLESICHIYICLFSWLLFG